MLPVRGRSGCLGLSGPPSTRGLPYPSLGVAGPAALCTPSVPLSHLPPQQDVAAPQGGQAHTPLHTAQPQLSPLLWSCCHHLQSSPGPCWLQTLREGNGGVTSSKKHRLLLLPCPPSPGTLGCACLGQAVPAVGVSGTHKIWELRGDWAGQRDTRGQQEPAPHCRQCSTPEMNPPVPSAPALLVAVRTVLGEENSAGGLQGGALLSPINPKPVLVPLPHAEPGQESQHNGHTATAHSQRPKPSVS